MNWKFWRKQKNGSHGGFRYLALRGEIDVIAFGSRCQRFMESEHYATFLLLCQNESARRIFPTSDPNQSLACQNAAAALASLPGTVATFAAMKDEAIAEQLQKQAKSKQEMQPQQFRRQNSPLST